MWNQFKTFLLLAVLTALLLGIGQLIGGTSGLVIAAVFAVAINFGTYWYADRLVLGMYRAKPAPRSEFPGLHDMVEELSKKAHIPKPRIFIVPLKASNAFATGRNPKNAVVAVTEGILKTLTPTELKGVLAHELAHIKNRDTLIMTVVATIAGVISYVAFFARFAAIFGGLGGRGRGGGNIIGLLVAAIIAPIIALLIQLAISRSREYIADERGSSFVGDPIPLANALLKLESSAKTRPLRGGGEATAHLFIVNPFSGGGIVKLFSTHPPMQTRIARLKKLKI